MVTRGSGQSAALCAGFEAAGARVVRLPLIELAPASDPRAVRRAAGAAADFDWLVFTSANAVDVFMPLVEAPSAFDGRCAAVGPATAAALRRYAVEPALEAAVSRAEGLVESLKPHLATGARVLLPRAEDARDDLPRGLRAAGAEVTAVGTYRKRLPAASAAAADRLFESELGWVTCTSPRIVRHLAGLFAGEWQRRRAELRAISIGPVTSAELRRLGVEPASEAERPSDRALVEAAVTAAGG